MNQFEPFNYSQIPNGWRERLRIHGFSAREFASKFKINLPHFYNVLNGKSSPTFEYAQRIEELMLEMIQDRDHRISAFRSSETKLGVSNETCGDTHKRIDGGLPSESSAPTQG
jgi:transcriptional regulator with XRE-family HTH domain